jgi:hypothetical protein
MVFCVLKAKLLMLKGRTLLLLLFLNDILS